MKATLYIDETGKFQPLADDSRSVGGLLIDSSIEPLLAKIHQDACDAISWPARLHAAEFGGDERKFRYLRVWLSEIMRQQKTVPSFLRAEEIALAKIQTELTTGAPQLGAWPGCVRSWKASTLSQEQGRLLTKCGAKLREHTRKRLKEGLQATCKHNPVYFVAGHVDNKTLSAEKAYQQCAEYVISIIEALEFKELTLYFAKPELGTQTSVEKMWVGLSTQGLTIQASKHDYDKGPAGLWIADSLLHWGFQDSNTPLLSSQKHGLGDSCVYALSTQYPAPIRTAKTEDPLYEVCQKTQKLLESKSGGPTSV